MGMPGEGTRPTGGRFCAGCRPSALTRRPHLLPRAFHLWQQLIIRCMNRVTPRVEICTLDLQNPGPGASSLCMVHGSRCAGLSLGYATGPLLRLPQPLQGRDAPAFHWGMQPHNHEHFMSSSMSSSSTPTTTFDLAGGIARRDFLKLSAAAVLGSQFLGLVTQEARADQLPAKMNLLLILTDQERAM